jgi:hypothetical protein
MSTLASMPAISSSVRWRNRPCASRYSLTVAPFLCCFTLYIPPSTSYRGNTFEYVASRAISSVRSGGYRHPVGQGAKMWMNEGPFTAIALWNFSMRSRGQAIEHVAV